MFQLTPIVKNILIINAVILFLEFIFKMTFAPIFGVHSIYSDYFYVFQYISYMWLHADLFHLFSNMFAVLVFAPMLERVWGSKRFLTFYLIAGIGAGVLYGVADVVSKQSIRNDAKEFVADPNPDAFYFFISTHGEGYNLEQLAGFSDRYFDEPDNPNHRAQAIYYVDSFTKQVVEGNKYGMVGASGAVFGVLLAFAMLFPNTELLLLFFPFPIKAKYLVFLYGAWELYSEIFKKVGDNISHITHLSGMLIAFLVLKYWQRQRGNFF